MADQYCTRSDLEAMFGVANIAMWADLDNDGDAGKITARITWAIELATDELKSRMRVLTYDISTVSSSLLVVNAVARRAGDLLYSPRSVSDEDSEKDLMQRHRKEYDMFLRQVSAGQLDLGLTRLCRPYPAVVTDSD